MVGHHNLRSVRDHNLRHRYTLGGNLLDLVHELINIECYTSTHDIHNVLVKCTRRNGMKCKFTILILDGMSCIRTTLETNDDISLIRKSISNLTLSFVTPVSANYCCYHNSLPFLFPIYRTILRHLSMIFDLDLVFYRAGNCKSSRSDMTGYRQGQRIDDNLMPGETL